MTPTTAAVMAASAPDSRRLARNCSTNGAPAKIHSIDGTNVTQVVSAAPSTPAATGENGSGIAKGGEEADELRHQDQRPGRRFREAEAVDHFRRGHPAIGRDRLLRHVGEQRIGAAEAHHRELGEEQADAGQHMVRAERERDQRDRRPPDHEADDARRSPPAASGRARRAVSAPTSSLSPSSAGDDRATRKPMSAAATTISGNGIAKK